jgi:hypothetical protein
MSVTTASVTTAVASHRPPRRALRKLIVTEFKAAWRDPAWLVLGLGVPVMLLVIFGLAPGFQKQIHGTHTTYMTAYVPLAAVVIAATASGGPDADIRAWVYRAGAGMLVALATLTALTGARTPVVWFKVCPVLLGGSAALLLAASLL